jgi:predicted phage-related endonuclease
MASTVIKKVETTVEVSTSIASLPNTAEALIAEYNDTKAAMKSLEDRKKEVEKALREMMGVAEVGTIDGVDRLVIHSRTRKGVDTKKLQEAYPEAYTNCETVTNYTVLLTK